MNEQGEAILRRQIREMFEPVMFEDDIDATVDQMLIMCARQQAIGQANATRNFSASLPAATREREKNAWLQGFDTAVDSHPSQWRFLRTRSPFEEVTADGNSDEDEHGTPQPQ